MILASVLLYMTFKGHIFKFKRWENVTLASFFTCAVLRFLSWVFVSDILFEKKATKTDELLLRIFDDIASLIIWGVLMNFVFSMHQLKIVLESESSQMMQKSVNSSRITKNIMLTNLIVMNMIIIGAETYVQVMECDTTSFHIWMITIPFAAYCIEFLGDILVMILFA